MHRARVIAAAVLRSALVALLLLAGLAVLAEMTDPVCDPRVTQCD